jgi:hypothetical protein
MRKILAALLLLVAPTLISAQDRSIFSLLETSGRSIGPAPALAEGALSDRDVLTGDGRRVQVWSLTGAQGNELQIDLRSDAFDAYVYVVGPGLGGGITDDDGGEDLDSRICLAASEPGEYRVIASSLSGDTGAFTLEVRRREGATTGTCLEEVVEEAPEIDDPWELPVDGRVLNVGDDVEGSLDEADPIFLGSPAEAWRIRARTGERFSVDLISDDFDAYLELEGPDAVDILDDDDGAGRCDARITLTFAESGEYVLVVTTLGSRRGAYRLVATREPGPVQSGSCLEVDEPPAESSSLEAVALVGALEVGATREATMTGSEAQFAGAGLQGWTLEARAGDRLAIDNVSDDFDSYLYLTGPGFPDYIYDDDSAGSLDARLCVEIPESATYRVYAGPLSGTGQAGRYRVLVREGTDELCSAYEMTPAAQARVLDELDTEGRTLAVGQEREGTLDPNGFRHPESDRVVQAWSLALTAGREVSIDLVSNAFDPVLYVLGPGLDEPLYADDFGGGVCNSRVTFSPSVTGTYRVLAGAYYDGGGGAFTLRAATDPPDIEQGGCVSPDDVGAGSPTAPSGGDPTLTGPLAGISSGVDRVLDIGTEVAGTLDASDEVLDTEQYAEAWAIRVSAGDEIVFELLSDDFDCILFIDDGTGSPMRDDDSAGNLDSRIVYTANEARTVRVVVSALSAGNSGSFRLRAIRRVP